jgi:beta-glucanase (GH16 family)
MRHITLFIFSLLSTIGTCFSQAASLDYSNWEILSEDNFNYNNAQLSTQLSAKWDFDFVHGPAFPNKDALGQILHAGYATTEAFSIENPGYLTITMQRKDIPYIYQGGEHYFSTGVLRSKLVDNAEAPIGNNRGMLYGMFEIRCRIPDGSGVTPAFWLAGTHSWPPEIDVFEVGYTDKRDFFASVHDGAGGSNSCGVHYSANCGLSEGFHTYTAIWSPTHISFYLDGAELYTRTSPYGNHAYWGAMDLITNLGIWYNDNSNNFKKLVIDYIKIFKPKKVDEFNSGNLPNNVGKDLQWSENRNALFYVTNDNNVYNIYWDTWSQPSGFWNHGKVKWDAPANCAGDLVWAEDRIILFYRGTDNNIYHIYWDTWSQPYGFWNYGKVKWDAPANCAGDLVWAEDRDVLFYKGVDNNVYHLYWDTWSQPSGFWNYGKVKADAPADCAGDLVWSADRDALFYRGTDNNVYNIYWDTWSQSSDFWNHGKMKWDAPANCAGDLTWSESRDALFYKGTDSKIYNIYWNTWSLPYGFWDYGQLNFVGSPDINLNSTYANDLKWCERTHALYFKGADTRLYRVKWINGQWNLVATKWQKTGGLNSSNTDIVSDLCFSNNQNRIFYKNINNKIGQLYFEDFTILNPACNNDNNKTPYSIQDCNSLTRSPLNIDNTVIESPEIKLYPMPFTDVIYLKGERLSGLSFEVYNTLGVRLKSGIIKNDQIAMNEIGQGTYLLKINGTFQKYCWHIVKQ